MKSILLKFLTVCAIVNFYSCNDKTSKAKENVVTEEAVKEDAKEESVFKITMNIIVPNDDTLEVFYLDYDNLNYSYKTKIETKVKGSPNPQDVHFSLPKEVFPTSLRFDFGTSKNEEAVTMNSVSMSYEDFNMSMTPQEFHSFFVPNKFTKYTKETGLVERQVVEGKYDPYFNSRAVFRKKLELEAR